MVHGRRMLPMQQARQLLSPRLAALAGQLKSGDKSALDRFWQELQDKGPLTEPIADDPKNSWVTFIWRGNGKTRRVTFAGGPPGPDWDGNATCIASRNGPLVSHRANPKRRAIRFIHFK